MEILEDEKESFYSAYKDLDKQFNTHRDSSYQHLVHFSRGMSEPIHRWFYYQEGYYPQLVLNIFGHLNIQSRETLVLDPFTGSGTTLLAAKQLGMKSTGFEINPFSAFMSEVKTRNYTQEDLKAVKEFKLPSYIPIPDIYKQYELKIIRNLFDEVKLQKIELLKKEIAKIDNARAKNLLFFALLSILERVSNYRKGGNGLKRKKVNKDLDPFEEFERKVHEINEDLEVAVTGPEPTVVNDSCLNISNYSIQNVGVSLFSPPYANCFDPFEVYKMELWLGNFVSSYSDLRRKRRMALASNLNVNLSRIIDHSHRTDLLNRITDYLYHQTLWDVRIPRMLDVYFHEMHTLLKSLYERTTNGGFCVIVIGNSAYGNLAIPTDIILSQIGEKANFKVKEIIIARNNETSSQQHKKLGNLLEYLRESVVVLAK
jgi:hypothetical protein